MGEMELDNLVAELGRVHAANLVSIILYGSSVTTNHVADVSDHNVLVVLETIAPEDLRSAHPIVSKWHKAGHPLPLYFTKEEIIDAADVFPIEFLDMSEHHRVLHGARVFDGFHVVKTHLRHQVEYELRGKLIRLRGLYIPASRSGERLQRLMTDSLPNFLTLFRHALGLLGHPTSPVKVEIIRGLGQHLGLNIAALQRVLELREQKLNLTLEEADKLFTGYLGSIEQVIEVVDSFESQQA